ncbi:putative reverse transcriptase domain-containing protein [Tanacetum coccineum]
MLQSPLPIVPHPFGSPNHVRAPPAFRAAMGRLRASSLSTHHPLHPSPLVLPPPSSLHLPPQVPTSLPLPSSPLPPLSSTLFIPPPVDRREDIPKAKSSYVRALIEVRVDVELKDIIMVAMPKLVGGVNECPKNKVSNVVKNMKKPSQTHRGVLIGPKVGSRKRLCLTALTSRYKVGESSTAAPRPTGGHRADYRFIGTMDAEIRRQRAEEAGYGIRDVWVDLAEVVEEVAPTTLEWVNARVTELVAVQEQDTHDIYAVIEDTQDRQTQYFKELMDWWRIDNFTMRLHDRGRRKNEPTSYREAITSSEGQQWREAIKSEIESILQNHTWELVALPPGCKALGYKWIFKNKMKADGTVDKYKARLVIQGFRQRKGLEQ